MVHIPADATPGQQHVPTDRQSVAADLAAERRGGFVSSCAHGAAVGCLCADTACLARLRPDQPARRPGRGCHARAARVWPPTVGRASPRRRSPTRASYAKGMEGGPSTVQIVSCGWTRAMPQLCSCILRDRCIIRLAVISTGQDLGISVQGSKRCQRRQQVHDPVAGNQLLGLAT